MYVRGTEFAMAVQEGIQPTPFSMFLASVMSCPTENATVIDAGAGTGVLSIVLAKHGARKVYAIERSPEACELIVKNSIINGVADRVIAVQADIRDYYPTGTVDYVVCNPPTMPQHGELPLYATGGGDDGFGFIDILIRQLPIWLGPHGCAEIISSSLVDWERMTATCARAHLSLRCMATMLLPLRQFYQASYSDSELTRLATSGQLATDIRAGRTQFNEFVRVHRCDRVS